MPPVLDQIVTAIENKLILTAFYEGYSRCMCPHAAGHKKGRLTVLCFQFAGESRRTLPPEGQWRCIPVDALFTVTLVKGEWQTGPAHTRPQNCLDQIIAEVGLVRPPVLDQIVTAIEKKLIVNAYYQGYRLVTCPHAAGHKNGILTVLCFQFAGESRRGLSPEGQWRCIPIDALLTVTMVKGEWQTGPAHTRPQNCLDQVIAEVAY